MPLPEQKSLSGAAAPAIAPPANSALNKFQVLRNSAAVVALTKPVAVVNNPAAGSKQSNDGKSGAAAKKNLDIDQYKYHSNLDFSIFNAVQELEKLVLHVVHVNGVEINQSLAGQRPGEVAKQFRNLAKTLKDETVSVADKGRALYQAGTYCEMYFQHNLSEDIRVHVRNFFMIRALDCGDVGASIEIAKACLSKDFHLAFSWLTSLMQQGNLSVLQLFQGWYQKGLYVNKSNESVETYQKFIEEIELRKVKNFIEKLDEKGVNGFIAQLEIKKNGLSDKEKADVDKFIIGLNLYKGKGCKAKENLLEPFNLDKIKKYAPLDANVTFDEMEQALAGKLTKDLQVNLQKEFKLYFLIGDYAQTVQQNSDIPDQFIVNLLSCFPDKSITLLNAFYEISQVFVRALKFYSDAIAMKFDARLVAFIDMIAESMGIKTDDERYEKFGRLQLDSCMAEMGDRIRRRTRTASVDMTSLMAELNAGTEVVALFKPVPVVEAAPRDVNSDGIPAAAATKKPAVAGAITLGGVIKTASGVAPAGVAGTDAPSPTAPDNNAAPKAKP